MKEAPACPSEVVKKRKKRKEKRREEGFKAGESPKQTDRRMKKMSKQVSESTYLTIRKKNGIDDASLHVYMYTTLLKNATSESTQS